MLISSHSIVGLVMAYYDFYCERLGIGFLAEPVNALTNFAFVIAGLVLWRQNRQSPELSIDILVLINLIILIGIGSALFHTFATTWARVLDVMPILLFQLMFVWIYTRKVMSYSVVASCTVMAAVLLGALGGRLFPHVLNGSLPYLPALIVLLALGIYHWFREKPMPYGLLVASLMFFAALSFRTIDASVCSEFPLGTHFLWHIINSGVLYLCVSVLIRVKRTSYEI